MKSDTVFICSGVRTIWDRADIEFGGTGSLSRELDSISGVKGGEEGKEG